MKVKTSELSGAALNWAVAKSTRKEMPSVPQWNLWDDYHPDTNWRHGGPLLDKHCTALNFSENGWWCHAGDHLGEGDTALIAVCRAIVASILGDEIELPEGLQ